jgi:hypothetical protein
MVAPTEDLEQILLLVDSPPQERYEGLRPVVLFGQSAAERARQLGIPKRTFYRRVERFDLLGMRSLFDPDPPTRRPRFFSQNASHNQSLTTCPGRRVMRDLLAHEQETAGQTFSKGALDVRWLRAGLDRRPDDGSAEGCVAQSGL